MVSSTLGLLRDLSTLLLDDVEEEEGVDVPPLPFNGLGPFKSMLAWLSASSSMAFLSGVTVHLPPVLISSVDMADCGRCGVIFQELLVEPVELSLWTEGLC